MLIRSSLQGARSKEFFLKRELLLRSFSQRAYYSELLIRIDPQGGVRHAGPLLFWQDPFSLRGGPPTPFNYSFSSRGRGGAGEGKRAPHARFCEVGGWGASPFFFFLVQV